MIIFIVESYFSKRDYSRFGIDIMQARGETVMVWDISQIHLTKKNLTQSFDQHLIFQNKSDFNKISANLKSLDFVIPMLALDLRNFYVWKSISASASKLVFVKLGGLPSFVPLKGLDKFSSILRNTLKKPRYFFDMLMFRVARKFLGVRAFDLFLLAGEKSKQPSFSDEKIIWATSLDYRLFSENPDLRERKHIVFLDEYEPFHPDFKKYSITTVSPDPYYKELNAFFSFLEKKYNLPVVVAAHPHVENLEAYKKYFNGRGVFIGETITLIRDARYVVAHNSTALQMAMLYERPIAVVTTDEMNMTYKKDIFPSYEVPYSFKAFNISHEKNYSSFEFDENKEGRERYLNDYTISKNIPPKIAWDIFCDKISSRN